MSKDIEKPCCECPACVTDRCENCIDELELCDECRDRLNALYESDEHLDNLEANFRAGLLKRGRSA